MKLRNLYTLICGLFLLYSAAHAGEIMTPENLNGCKIITIEEAKILIDKKQATFFDVRNAINYGKGHLPKALSLPFKGKVVKDVSHAPSLNNIDLSKLPKDKSKNIVFYSHGPTGWKSYFAAAIALEAGHKNVLWMRDGYSGWAEKFNGK